MGCGVAIALARLGIKKMILLDFDGKYFLEFP